MTTHTLDEIVHGGRRYVLREPLVVATWQPPGTAWLAASTSHRTSIGVAYGDSETDALTEYAEVFDHQWRCLVETDPDRLTPEGQRRAQALRELVLRVEEVEL